MHDPRSNAQDFRATHRAKGSSYIRTVHEISAVQGQAEQRQHACVPFSSESLLRFHARRNPARSCFAAGQDFSMKFGAPRHDDVANAPAARGRPKRHEPCDGITGCTLAFNLTKRFDERRAHAAHPFASAFARSSIIVRVSARSAGADAASMRRTRFTCNAAPAPSKSARKQVSKPVLIPYAVAPTLLAGLQLRRAFIARPPKPRLTVAARATS